MASTGRPILRSRTSSAKVEARGMSLGAELGRLTPSIRRMAGRLGGAAEAWLDTAPASIAESVSIEGLQHGVLTLAVDSAAAKFRVDRVLREGLETRLRAKLPSIRGVRVRIATPKDVEEGRSRGDR